MTENALTRKMKLKADQRAAVIDAPEGYLEQLEPLPRGVEVATVADGPFDWVQVFVRNRAELEAMLPRVVPALKPESLIWISFPKGSSKIQTDLTRDRGWDSVETFDLKWVSLVSVNETWSAFGLRPYRPGEVRTSWQQRTTSS